jgi:peptide/nickel transport system substrate-binding protein
MSSRVPRIARALAAATLAVGTLLPAVAPAAAADPLILRVGLLQDLDSLNPYGTALTVGYEAYELTYDQLVGFGKDVEPAAAYAVSWTRAADGHSWTFKIRPGMKWSDGQPATSADACFSWQLSLDAIKNGTIIGLGYLDPNLSDAGVTAVSCPDPETMIATTDDSSDRILQTYIPILPQHIWGKYTYKTIGDQTFTPPKDGSGLVGTGPYLIAEWKTGQYVRFVRNKSYWGNQGAEDEIIFQFYKTNDTMVQALKSGAIDYARTISSDQFAALTGQPNIVPVAGKTNGWTELGFNTYGTGTGKTIKGGGPSTKALQDPAFRDALGYAIDKQTLLDRVVGGRGTIGTTQVPPILSKWHVDPTDIRTFDIALAKQKLDTAGYPLDASGNRLDKEGKPISLRLVMPDEDPNFPKEAQFIQDWFGQLGIKVVPKIYDTGSLVDIMLPPEAGGAANKADYDLFIWTWSGNPDPNALLNIFLCSAIGGSSDSNWCNHDYDTMYDQQNVAPNDAARLAILTQMQQLWYDQAPYHILFYDDQLDAYRTDKFVGWQNQPPDGVPLFSYSAFSEPLLQDATKVVASPAPSSGGGGGAAVPSGAPASTGPSAAPAPAPSETSSSSLPIVPIVVVAVVIVAVIAVVLGRRRRPTADDEDD